MFDKIFQLNPTGRITSIKALEHLFFSPFHDPEDEPDGNVLDNQFECNEHSLEDWKSNLKMIKVICINKLKQLNLRNGF